MKTTDLCDKFPERFQVAEPIGWHHFGKRTTFNGKIVTVKCFEDNSLVRATLETDGTGKVLVVDGGGSRRCALLGDILADLAYKNHWNGVVVYGSIRDADAIGEIELGVVALGTHPRKSNKNNEGQTNLTVHFAGIDFAPNATIYVDRDGMIVSAPALE